MKRTGSIRSRVGPAVSSTRLPASGPDGRESVRDVRRELRRFEHAAGADFAAGLVALARAPDVTPRDLSVATLACVAALAHISAIHGRRERDRRVGGEAQGS